MALAEWEATLLVLMERHAWGGLVARSELYAVH